MTLYTGKVPSKMIGTGAPLHLSSISTSINLQFLSPHYNCWASLSAFNVYHEIGQTGTFTKIVITDMATRTYTLDSSSPGASAIATGDIVDFYMTTTNIIGESIASDVLTLYVAAVPSKPDVPVESKVFPITSSIGGRD